MLAAHEAYWDAFIRSDADTIAKIETGDFMLITSAFRSMASHSRALTGCGRWLSLAGRFKRIGSRVPQLRTRHGDLHLLDWAC